MTDVVEGKIELLNSNSESLKNINNLGTLFKNYFNLEMNAEEIILNIKLRKSILRNELEGLKLLNQFSNTEKAISMFRNLMRQKYRLTNPTLSTMDILYLFIDTKGYTTSEQLDMLKQEVKKFLKKVAFELQESQLHLFELFKWKLRKENFNILENLVPEIEICN